MESYNNEFSEMSNASIKLKLREIGTNYEYIKQEILKLCDNLEILEKEYKKGKG